MANFHITPFRKVPFLPLHLPTLRFPLGYSLLIITSFSLLLTDPFLPFSNLQVLDWTKREKVLPEDISSQKKAQHNDILRFIIPFMIILI